MAQPLPKNLYESPSHVGRYKRSTKFKSRAKKLDANTIASTLQLKEEKRDLIYSFIALVMKLGFLSIAISSLFNLGIASHQRLRRSIELSSLLNSETKKFEMLSPRLDLLFTIGGKERLIEEQDQWIKKNSIRVIWR